MSTSHVVLQAILSKTVERFPEKVVIRYNNQTITYGELDRLSSRFANALVGLGVNKGDRVAVFLGNCPQFVIA
ncbi:MAG: AMP-binding protein, partial [Candidatus Bathyarchaeota archaeon]|nr:AMP-binding protein [Candidatus Termiticorpusculum sp.]